MFKSEFDCHGLKFRVVWWCLGDQEDVIYESLPEGDCPDKCFLNGFFMTAHEEVGIWWCSLCSHGYADKLEKMPVNE